MIRYLKYIWLLLAVGAFIGVCCGETHQIGPMAIASLMYAVCRNDDDGEE